MIIRQGYDYARQKRDNSKMYKYSELSAYYEGKNQYHANLMNFKIKRQKALLEDLNKNNVGACRE